MKSISDQIRQIPYYNDIRDCVKKPGKCAAVSGCVDQAKPYVMSTLAEGYKRKLIITTNEVRARKLYEDYRAIDKKVVFYPAKDFIFYSADIHGNQIVRERLEAISRLIFDDEITVITTIDGCMDKLMPPEYYAANLITIRVGDDIDVNELSRRLTELGYERCAQVDYGGQYAIRGGIIDIYPLTFENPYRIELWDTEVDSMRTFDAASQRSIENIEEVTIFPAAEIIVDNSALGEGWSKIEKEAGIQVESLRKQGRAEAAGKTLKNVEMLKERLFVLEDHSALESYVTYFYENASSFIEYFGDDAIIFMDEPARIKEKTDLVFKEFADSMQHRLESGNVLPGQANVLLNEGELYSSIAKRRCVSLSFLDVKLPDLNVSGTYDIYSKSASSYNNSFKTLIEDIASWRKKKYRVVLVSASRSRAERLAENLRDNDVTAVYSEDPDRQPIEGEVLTVSGRLSAGFEFPQIRFVCITEEDIFGTISRKRKKKSEYNGRSISDFSELSVGDYVIHENYGLGVYKGIEKISAEGIEKDYIKIQYADNGNLYILATQLDLIQKYADSEAKKPRLNKLGTSEWSRTKEKVTKSVGVVARELVELYAHRQSRQGYVFDADNNWQREFEELFPYEETEDQLNAIADVKADMQSDKIMDRLICGDVGFGKTEVVLRAAFKAVMNSKQVAYLVPTTILAKQHFTTFDSRMKDFGIKVAMLSRFCTPTEIKQILSGLKDGSVDVVVGTHRLLSSDVKYKDLGLLIIDEEQRFGVNHKEKIKQMRENVDVISLSATPIPRTMHMSLIGVRDMSVLDEAPVDRLPIQTFVSEYDEEMIREAINREMARGGQVYYVFNKIQGIEDIAARIQKLVPDARIEYAHGRMNERQLENIMTDFIEGEIDVLISTTIIETGLDIPNVNTIIIHDSDKFGLAQLYQLRGRVGRSGRTAYAFLMYRRDKLLKEVAEKRLGAIREFTELGSGYKIAMKDLEIRGAGNLLGKEQSGHMEAVGYDLYCKMLNEAVNNLKGIPMTTSLYETTVDLVVDAFVPATYIRSENTKLDVYKRIAGISTRSELEDMQDELTDRFGELPKAADNLLGIAYIKSIARNSYITEIKGNKREISIAMYPGGKIDPSRIPPLISATKGLRFVNGAQPYFTYVFGKGEASSDKAFLDSVMRIVECIATLKDETQ